MNKFCRTKRIHESLSLPAGALGFSEREFCFCELGRNVPCGSSYFLWVMSSRVAFSLLGFAAAQTDGLRFYAPVQPALQQALQPTAGLAYPRPVAVDALQPPVLI